MAPKVAGSSPVGHPPHKLAVCSGPLEAKRDGKLYEEQKMSGEGVDSLGFRACVALCRVCAPSLPVRHAITRFRKVCCTAFREPLQFIVMSVMVVISLYL